MLDLGRDVRERDEDEPTEGAERVRDLEPILRDDLVRVEEDVDAGRILEGRATLPEVGREIHELLQRVARGEPTKSEALGHQEFILTYKSFAPLGPACLPV